MSVKFAHSSKFNIGELEKENFEVEEEVNGVPFVLVHKRSYLEFCVTIYPNGAHDDFNGERVEGVLIGIDSLNADTNLKISYRLAILLPAGSSHLIAEGDEECSLDGYGSGNFCTEPIASNLSELKSKSLLLDDNNTLCVAMEIKVEQSYFDVGEDVEKKISAFDFKDIGFWSKVYAKNMEGKASTDYKLRCKNNGQKFPIHKILARERSPYFENLIGSHPNFHQEKSHEVDWSSAVIEEVRFFLYHDNVSEKFEAVPLEELAQVAGMLELDKLLAICEKSFMARVCEDNVWEYLNIAETLSMKFLKNKAFCAVTEDPKLMEKLTDDRKEKQLRKEVGEFLMKRGRAQLGPMILYSKRTGLGSA